MAVLCMAIDKLKIQFKSFKAALLSAINDSICIKNRLT